MKKPTLSLEGLRASLAEAASDLHELARFDLDDEGVRDWINVAAFQDEFFILGDPSPAPERGRGQRLKVPVGWIWFPADMAPEEGASVAATRLRAIPGVEEVSEPALDPLLGAIWGVDLVIRLSQ